MSDAPKSFDYAHLDPVACIRRGLAQAKTNVGRSADDVFDDLEREA